MMDIIPDQIKESPVLWDFFSWWDLLVTFLIVVAALSLVAIVGSIARKFGGDPATFFYLGLKFPPGHPAHVGFFFIIDIMRLFACPLSTIGYPVREAWKPSQSV